MNPRIEIVCEFVNPPIPDRNLDWFAYVKGEEGDGYPRGHGRTATAAISSLLEKRGEPETPDIGDSNG